MFVHAFDGEDYVCDYDSEFESVFLQNKFVENDVKSSLSFSKSLQKKESVLNYLVDKAVGMLCRYDVFIFGGLMKNGNTFSVLAAKVDDEIKTASDISRSIFSPRN
jgi:hypothetical protein